jgi:putative oxidoreductase
MNHSLQNFAALGGRVLLAAIFLISGLNKLSDFSGTAAFMSGSGLPAAEFLLVLTLLIEIAGGLMIVLGLYTRQVALILFLFMIPVTAVFHNPWVAGDPAQAQQQMIHFLKNLAIMGGLLHLSAFGPGYFSIEARRSGTASFSGF